MTDLAIENGKLVTPAGILEASLIVESGKIARITHQKVKAEETIDAHGLYVIPGLIDAHVHFRDFGESYKADWESESRAAAAGGVTTVLDMPNNKPSINTAKRLDEKRKLAGKKSVIDFGLYFGAQNDNLGEIKKISNVAGVKFFLGKSTGDLLFDEKNLPEFFRVLKERDILAVCHCEKFALIEKYKNKKTWKYFDDIRPDKCEAESIKDVLNAMCGNRVHICHVTSDLGLHEVLRGKKVNKNLTCEVTPQHLWLNKDDEIKRGAYLKMYPPLRSKSDNAALFMGLRSGLVDIVATDHAPHTTKEKELPFGEAPGGVPGVETRLPLVLDHTDVRGLVETCCAHPAKIFRIKDKGSLVEGYDADFVLLDLKEDWTITNDSVLTKVGWTPFDGLKVKGKVKGTYVRGQQVYDGEQPVNNQGTEAKFG